MSIPAEICASQALARGAVYAGALDASGLQRLRELAPKNLIAEMTLRVDTARRKWIESRISGDLTLECRVCVEPFAWRMNLVSRLALARDEEEEEQLMADCEPLLVLEDRLMLHEIIEDEVLLALPMMPKCPACENARPPQGGTLSGSPSPPEKKPGALAGLKNLSLTGASPARRK